MENNRWKYLAAAGGVFLIALIGIMTDRFFLKRNKPEKDPIEQEISSEVSEPEEEKTVEEQFLESMELDVDKAADIFAQMQLSGCGKTYYFELLQEEEYGREAMVRNDKGSTFYILVDYEGKLLEIREENDNGKILYAAKESDSSEESIPEELAEEINTITESTDKTLEMLKARKAGINDPLKVGEWGIAGIWAGDDRFEPVAVRITKVTRGEPANAVRQAYIAATDIYGFSDVPLEDNLEYVAIEYELYVPQDNSASAPWVRMYIADTNGAWIDTSSYRAFDTMMDVTTVNQSEVKQGETGRFIAFYTMEKNRYAYLLKVGDSNLENSDFLWILIDETTVPVPEEPQSAPEESVAPEEPTVTSEESQEEMSEAESSEEQEKSSKKKKKSKKEESKQEGGEENAE